MAIKFESFRGTGGAVTGGLTYKGSYDAATNTPVLTSAKKGDFYIVSVGGTLAGVTLNVDDHIVFNQDASAPITSAMFDVIDNTDAVASVNGQTGVVVLDTDDVSEGATNQYYTNARADARIAAATANDLSDVDYTAGAGIDGYVLTYNNTTGNWEAQVSAGGSPTLQDVTDNGNTTTTNIETAQITVGGDVLADGNLTRTIGSDTNRFLTAYSDLNGAIRFKAQNDSGGVLNKGDIVYIKGVSGGTPTVDKAQANSASTMPAFGLVYANANNGASVQIVTLGNLEGINTGSFAVGDTLFVSATSAGALVNSAPAGESNLIQNIAKVVKVDGVGTSGIYKVGGAGRTNATPNLDSGKIFLGNGANQAVSTALNTVNLSSLNNDLDTDDIPEGATNLYYTNARFDTQLATKTTDNLTEGVSNLYYTNARFDTQLATKDTDDVAEGATNLYYTNARADARIAAATANDLSDVSYTAGAGIDGYVMTYNNTSGNWEAQVAASAPVTSVNTQTGAVVLDTDDVSEGVTNLYYTNARFDTQLATKDTDNLSEGATNLYYTNARADARIAAATANDLSDVSYTAGAGIDGYVMTYNNTSGNWEAQVAASAPVTSVNTQTGAVVLDTDDVAEGATNLYYTNARFDTQLATKTTDNLTEGSTNLYYTNARADARIAAATANDLSDVSYTAGAGIDGYVLTYNNTSGNWEAQVASGGGFTYSAITSASSPVSGAASTHYSADTSGGTITINLPALSGVTAGTEIRVKLKTAGNTLTLDGNLTETIDGSTTYTLTVQNQAVTLVSDGSSNWEVI